MKWKVCRRKNSRQNLTLSYFENDKDGKIKSRNGFRDGNRQIGDTVYCVLNGFRDGNGQIGDMVYCVLGKEWRF